MGRGYQGQGHRPSSGLIHELHQGVGAASCACVSHARHRGGGSWFPKTAVGGGAAIDSEEVNDGEKQKEDRDWLHGARVPRAGP